jgi:hypothetical protein
MSIIFGLWRGRCSVLALCLAIYPSSYAAFKFQYINRQPNTLGMAVDFQPDQELGDVNRRPELSHSDWMLGPESRNFSALAQVDNLSCDTFSNLGDAAAQPSHCYGNNTIRLRNPVFLDDDPIAGCHENLKDVVSGEQESEFIRLIFLQPFCLIGQEGGHDPLYSGVEAYQIGRIQQSTQFGPGVKSVRPHQSRKPPRYTVISYKHLARGIGQLIPGAVNQPAVGSDGKAFVCCHNDDAGGAQQASHSGKYEHQLPPYIRFSSGEVTDSWTEGSSIVFALENRDIDASYDAKHWFHLSGKFCYYGLPSLDQSIP